MSKHTIFLTALGVGDLRDIKIVDFRSKLMIEAKDLSLSEPSFFFLLLFELFEFKMSGETLDLDIF